MKHAPIVLFTYNRSTHTKKTLDALANNPEAKDSELYIYCDGPKHQASKEELDEINKVVKLSNLENRFKKVTVTVQKQNKGLANSIVDGVTEILELFDSVIVLEDDIVTSVGFLEFMNKALSLYENEEQVMHVSGYMYPTKALLPETFFYNVPLCWGWATWKSAWTNFRKDALGLWTALNKKSSLLAFDKLGGDYLSRQLAYNVTGKLDTWFIKWHASVFLKNGFTLYPNKSLVENIGFDNSGVHNGKHSEFRVGKLATKINVNLIDLEENIQAERVVKQFYDSLQKKSLKKGIKHLIRERLRQAIFLILPDLKNVLKYNHQVYINKSFFGVNTKVYPSARLSNTIIGDYTYISENAVINNAVIGRFCSIGAYFMAGRGLHPLHGISTHPMFYSTGNQNGISLTKQNKTEEFKQITIGNDVFIGMHVTILDGVTIGDGAVIGAGAVVSKDIPAYAIAVGNPIKILKYRFESEVINRLLEIKWWHFNEKDLSLIEKHFFEVESFLNQIHNNYN